MRVENTNNYSHIGNTPQLQRAPAMKHTPFRDQTILVTGATRGLGRAICETLATHGAHIIAVGRDQAALEQLQTELSAQISTYQVDLAQKQALDALIDQLAGTAITGLINNAGVQHQMRLSNCSLQDLQNIETEIAVNLHAPIRLTTRLLPHLTQSPNGFVCNITSSLALAPKESAPAYCATKAGLRSFTRALRDQCAAEHPEFLVNEVLPALIETDMTAGRDMAKDLPDTVAKRILEGIAKRQSETWIGKARLLRHLYSLSPALVARILR